MKQLQNRCWCNAAVCNADGPAPVLQLFHAGNLQTVKLNVFAKHTLTYYLLVQDSSQCKPAGNLDAHNVPCSITAAHC